MAANFSLPVPMTFAAVSFWGRSPAGSGNLQQGLGVNIQFTSDDRALDAARSAAMDWVRMDLFWSSVEPQTNQFN